jgi:hypothetical protein
MERYNFGGLKFFIIYIKKKRTDIQNLTFIYNTYIEVNYKI